MKRPIICCLAVIIAASSSSVLAKQCQHTFFRSGQTVTIGGWDQGTHACIKPGKKEVKIICRVSHFSGKANLLVTQNYFLPRDQFNVHIVENGQVIRIQGKGMQTYASIDFDYAGPYTDGINTFKLTCNWMKPDSTIKEFFYEI